VGIAAGRSAIVTGAASGFGLEMARRLLAVDASVVGVDASRAGLEAAVAELGSRFVAYEGDVRDPASMTDAVATAVRHGGDLDTLIVSAGVIHIKPLAEVTEADWDLTLDVNLKGAFLVIQAAAPHIAGAGPRGRIVAISSDAGKRGFGGIAAYSASKFGLIGLVESVAVELAPSGATVNAVCPVGTPSTGMGLQVLDMKVRATGRTADAILESAAGTNPLGRNADVADVAAAIEYFLSDEAGFLTGNALDVDGGAHLGFLPGA
jgi:NAD(P)-dependent dehydrogenase (short-subunit alcohol dehydrogenase family)